MSRSLYGTWGLDLHEDDFACALAAYGTLYRNFRYEYIEEQGNRKENLVPDLLELFKKSEDVSLFRRSKVYWGLRPLPEDLLHHRGISVLPARMFADAWMEASQGWSIRFELSLSEYEPVPWVIRQLTLPAVRADSAYVEYYDPQAIARWTWPLHTACLNDMVSRRLHDRLSERSWPQLSDVEIFTPDLPSCDVLLLPWSLRESVGRILQFAYPIKATLVVVLNGFAESWDRARVLKAALLNETGAAGICIADIPEEKHVDWYNDLIMELSHNSPLDVALQQAAGWGSWTSYFFTTNQLLSKSMLTNVVHRMADRMSSLPVDEGIDVPPESAAMLGLSGGKQAPADIAEQLRARVADFYFESEGGEATSLAELYMSARDVLGPTEALTRPPRWIQARVFEEYQKPDRGEEDLHPEEESHIPEEEMKPVPVTHLLRPEAVYSLEVFIGPVDAETDSLIAPEAVPEYLFSEDVEHQLTVVFSEPYHAPIPQVARINLPVEGRSTSCQFYFRTLADQADFEARIILLHENRVLQTALLRARVADEPGPEYQPIALEMETVIHSVQAGLEARRQFDAAFVFNRSEDGKPRSTVIMGERAALFSLEGIATAKENIDSKLAEVAYRPSSFPRKLRAKATEELLFYLAYQGHSIYRGVVIDHLGSESPYRDAGRIQIVSTSPGSFFPLEFLYDLPAPDVEAGLCPEARSALEKGSCEICISPTNDGKIYLCPLGFWGIRKVIERHINDRDAQPPGLSGPFDYALTRVPLEGRKTLKPLSASVFAASDKVDKYKDPKSELPQSKRIFTALNYVMPDRVERARTWEVWVDKIEKLKPSLLVLMPHMETEFDLPVMEIGAAGEYLHVEKINASHVISGEGHPPLVFLMGCETMKAGEVEIPFQSLVGPFRQNGAALVLSTRTKIRGRHSIPVFEKVIEILSELDESTEARSFGDVMRMVRRKALADGLPMVLSLFAYGDADWLLANS